MALTSRLILLAATLSLRAAEKLAIVSVSPDLVVREGESVNMSCGADQDWFFCLWKHPSGVKECTIQENGGYRSVCAGLNYINIFGGDRSCSVSVENVSLRDHGTFMCLLNQADVFHTDMKYVNLAVATAASLEVTRLGGGGGGVRGAGGGGGGGGGAPVSRYWSLSQCGVPLEPAWCGESGDQRGNTALTVMSSEV